MEAAVGERATQAFVEEQGKERNLNAFGGELIGIAAAIAFQQVVAFEFAADRSRSEAGSARSSWRIAGRW